MMNRTSWNRSGMAVLGIAVALGSMSVMATAESAKEGISSVVTQFEKAYQKRDSKTMLVKLMAPTQNADMLEKRSMWLRGYGPHDLPGTKHPPILFDSNKGSFVPTSFKFRSVNVTDPTHGEATVEEVGKYHDEDGNYKVTRIRLVKCEKVKGKWMISDYLLRSNPEEMGFIVDDIDDKITKL